MSVTLTEEEKARIGKYVPAFRQYLSSEEGREDSKRRDDRTHFFQKHLPDRLTDLSEKDVLDLVERLWSASWWRNKQWVVDDLIRRNGLEGVAQILRKLLDRSKGATQRYGEATETECGLGPAAITEMLCHAEPTQCCVWNRPTRDGLAALDLGRFVSPRKYQPSAGEYERFNELAAAIGACLRGNGIDADLLAVSYFLYRVSKGAAAPEDRQARAPKPGTGTDFDHNEVKDLIYTIGELLGFDVSTEVKVASGAQVDVLWKAKVGNLGTISYVFEVHKSGSMDSLVLNLVRARANPTVQRVVAVSDEAQLQRLLKECESVPGDFKQALALWQVDKVFEVADNLRRAHELISELGLARGEPRGL